MSRIPESEIERVKAEIDLVAQRSQRQRLPIRAADRRERARGRRADRPGRFQETPQETETPPTTLLPERAPYQISPIAMLGVSRLAFNALQKTLTPYQKAHLEPQP